MISKIIIIILIYIGVISSFLVLSLSSTNSLNESIGNCNNCHGPTATGHVEFSITLTGATTVEVGTPTTITATMVNSYYPLISVSISLASSPDFSFTKGSSSTFSVGTLGRGATQAETWNVIFHGSKDYQSKVLVNFQGEAFASSHMQNTYTQQESMHIQVTTQPIAILQVVSNPLPESTIFIGSSNNTGLLTVQNVGQVAMNDTTVTTTGPVLVNNATNFTIPQIAPQSSLSFPIKIDTSKSGVGTITVTYMGTFIQTASLTIYLRPNPADSIELFLGRLFGYIAYVLLFCSVVAGAGIYHLKKYISGRKIRILHSDLANLSFTMVIIHAITLTIPNSPWSTSYAFFQILPMQIPYDIGTLGLELGRNALVLMYVALFSGFNLSILIKRFGKRVGISIDMLSYDALIFGFIHTALIGGWANSYPIIIVIMFISLLSVGFLKWDAQRMLNAKKKAYKQRVEARKLAEAKLADTTSAGENIEPKVNL